MRVKMGVWFEDGERCSVVVVDFGALAFHTQWRMQGAKKVVHK